KGNDSTKSATAAASSATATRATPATPDQWEQLDYASTAISPTALAPLSLVQLQHIRGIIFGKHGRVFEDSTLQHWLLTRAWYRPDANFTNARLSSRERENLDVVREAEAKKHPQIETGDMRFYQNRVITTAMLGEHTPQ